jgi:hypothetical protein
MMTTMAERTAINGEMAPRTDSSDVSGLGLSEILNQSSRIIIEHDHHFITGR